MRYQSDEEDDEDLADDPENPDESDMDDDDDPEQIACPHCKKWMPEIADVCRHCGNFVSEDDLRPRKPVWVIALIILLVAACGSVIGLWLRS